MTEMEPLPVRRPGVHLASDLVGMAFVVPPGLPPIPPRAEPPEELNDHEADQSGSD